MINLELPRKNRTILWSFAQKFGPQDQKHRSPLHLCIQPCWGTAGSFSGPCAIQPWTPSTPRFDQKDLRGRNRRMSMVPWQFGVRSFRLYIPSYPRSGRPGALIKVGKDEGKMVILFDASEIPANSPVEVGRKSHLFTGFGIHPTWLFGISEASTVAPESQGIVSKNRIT